MANNDEKSVELAEKSQELAAFSAASRKNPTSYAQLKANAGRKGLSVSEYILELAAKEEQQAASEKEQEFTEINKRLADVGRQLEQIKHSPPYQYPQQQLPQQQPVKSFASEFKDMMEAITLMKQTFPSTTLQETVAQIKALEEARESLGSGEQSNDMDLIFKAIELMNQRKEQQTRQAPIDAQAHIVTPDVTQPAPIISAKSANSTGAGNNNPIEEGELPIEPLTDAEIGEIVKQVKQNYSDKIKMAKMLPKSVVLKFLQRQFNLLPDEAEKVYRGIEKNDMEHKSETITELGAEPATIRKGDRKDRTISVQSSKESSAKNEKTKGSSAGNKEYY